MAIGEAVLEAFLEVVFEKLVFSPGVDLFLRLRGGGNLDATMNQWKYQLRMIKDLVDDAEQKKCQDNRVKTWLDDLQVLAYDIDDILDDFAFEAQPHESNNPEEDVENDLGFLGSINNMVRNISDSLSTIFTPISPGIQSRIDGITVRLQGIQTEMQFLGLTAAHTIQQQTLQTEALRKQRESTHIAPEPKVFGRDVKKKHIITLLLNHDQSYENPVVIPIVGKGGIGKTILAQCLYNDEQVKSHFEMKAWVCVSDVFDVKRIMTTIINSITHSKVEFSDLNLAQEELIQLLTGKRFFIVLDDIWSDNYDGDWSQLRTPFRYGAKGSRVVITTRIVKIARMMATKHNTVNKLEGLSGDDCWRVFQQHANQDTDLAEMRDDIVQKCKGLPLAAKSLAGLLRKTMKSDHQRILNSNVWSEDNSSVLPVLRLSYQHLPTRQKCVFAYCSVLPKDYLFEEMEIIKLWMAQGFLIDNNNGRMEDIGHEYFHELVSRSLFDEYAPDANEFPFGLGPKRFTMHDLIHDLAKWAAGSLCCVTDTMHMQKDLDRTRHLFVTDENGIDGMFGNQLLASPLRTFLCSYDSDLNIKILDYVLKFRYIRTLRLSSWKIVELPESIGDLKHLQFLDLKLPEIKVLPNSISRLHNLQILQLNHCYHVENIPDISDLLKLRYLFVGSTNIKEMPWGIGKLINLQSLNKFVLAAGGGSRLRELKSLNDLHGGLEIYGVGNVIKVEDAQEAQLHKKTSLEELFLYWEMDVADDNTTRDVVEQLQPHTSIKKFKLYRYKGLTFPRWLGDSSFKNMVHISLLSCEKCKWLPPLGQLPKLEILCVDGMKSIKEVGPEFYGRCSTPFPVLRTLYFEGMNSWEKWVNSPVDNNTAFPCLEKLKISFCPSLQGDIPPHLPSLKNLEILECMEMSVSLPSLPLLEELRVNGCKMLSNTADVITCSKRMYLYNISEIIGLPGQIHLTLRLLNVSKCENLKFVEFKNSLSYLSPGSEEKSPNVDGATCSSIVGVRQEKNDGFYTKPTHALPRLFLLQSIMIDSCQNLESLPSEFHNLNCLTSLMVEKCPKINRFPDGGLPINLKYLDISEMKIEQPVQEWGLHLLHSLQCLELNNVGSCGDSVECIPCPDISLPPSLYKLMIKSFQNLKTISTYNTLPNLTLLFISHCPNLKSLVGDLPSLTNLSLGNCPEFRYFPEGRLSRNLTKLQICKANIEKPIQKWGLHLLTSLKDLTLYDIGSSSDTLDSISHVYLPSSLSQLYINGFQNLKTICCCTLPNLTYIYIKSCPKFKSFGDNGLPSQLQDVEINGCNLIKSELRSDPAGRIQMNGERYSLC